MRHQNAKAGKEVLTGGLYVTDYGFGQNKDVQTGFRRKLEGSSVNTSHKSIENTIFQAQPARDQPSISQTHSNKFVAKNVLDKKDKSVKISLRHQTNKIYMPFQDGVVTQDKKRKDNGLKSSETHNRGSMKFTTMRVGSNLLKYNESRRTMLKDSEIEPIQIHSVSSTGSLKTEKIKHDYFNPISQLRQSQFDQKTNSIPEINRKIETYGRYDSGTGLTQTHGSVASKQHRPDNY